MNLTHKEMTAHIRNRIKIAKIKARVSMNVRCGQKYITVAVPNYDTDFNADQCQRICEIAKVNHLTNPQKSEINPVHERQLTGRKQWDFEFHN